MPSNRYEMNGYEYQTDERGRIVSAEGKLRLRDPDYKRNTETVRNIEDQEYRPNDDQGHLIGHQFGGSDKFENLVPMDAKINQIDYAKLENTLAKAIKDAADVRLKIQPSYENDSTRPTEFIVTYSIDNDKNMINFKNESEVQV